MSYARFSSDEWRSDVYVYDNASTGGWTTHVAANRYAIDYDALGPPVPYPTPEQTQAESPEFTAWVQRYKALQDAVHHADRVPIDAHCAGQTYTDDSPGACAVRLMGLRDLGYRVPQSALDRLAEEQADIDHEATDER